MSVQKPLKVDQQTGKLAQFTTNDELPNQVDINYLRNLFGRLLIELQQQGIELQDEGLQEELNFAIKNM